METKKVHIKDAAGRIIFDHLLDHGHNCLMFASPSGCIDRLDIEREHWTVCEGWDEEVELIIKPTQYGNRPLWGQTGGKRS